MHSLESSYIVDNLVARIRRSTALGSESLPNNYAPEIEDADVVIYEDYIGSGRFLRLKGCALDSLDLILEATEPVDLKWNPCISYMDREFISELYPIAKCALSCIYSQLDDILLHAARYKEIVDDSATLTFEGIFLIVKTVLEMLDPVVLGLEMTIFTMLLKILEMTKSLRPLLNACLACLTTYISRLFSHDLSQDIQEGITAILSRIKSLLEQVIVLVIENEGDDRLNADPISFLRTVTNTVLERLRILNSQNVDGCKQSQIDFVLRMVDCWYGVQVGLIMRLRADMIHTGCRPVKLARLMRLISRLPLMPGAHRLRIVIQIALTLRQDVSCTVQAEALCAIMKLMDTEGQEVSEMVTSNVRPLADALVEVLLDRRLCGNTQVVGNRPDCEGQIQLVYCLAMCIRISRRMPPVCDPENADEFLQNKILTLLNVSCDDEHEGDARIDQMMKDTRHLAEINCGFPSLEYFMNNRNDCDMLTRLLRAFNYLLNYSNEDLDEAIALVSCWLFQEFEFSICLKLVAPLCLQYLRTKRSKMIDEIHNVGTVPTGLALVSKSAMSRWVMGGRLFSTALEAYRDNTKEKEMEVDTHETTQKAAHIFDSLFDATLDILKETAGSIPKDLEDCLGLYIRLFGINNYLKAMPLAALYSIPITSEMFKIGSHSYMLPVLSRQLKGVDMEVYMHHFYPVLKEMEMLEKRAKSCSITNSSAEAIISHASRSYEALIDSLYNILISMASEARDCKEVLESNDYELLKHILSVLDQGIPRAIVASRFIGACNNLDGIAPKLIGLLVKRFVTLQSSFDSHAADTGNPGYTIEDALLGAISNCGRFCESRMLADNLLSFEKALTRSASKHDPSVKIARALLPSVDDEHKVQLHRHWIYLLNLTPSRNLYLALKRSCETAEAELEAMVKKYPIEPEMFNHRGRKNAEFMFVREVCCLDGLKSIAGALKLLPIAVVKQDPEDQVKQRISCINSYVRLLVKMKKLGVFDEGTKEMIQELVKSLTMEAMVNVVAANNMTRTNALFIYDGVCELMLSELDTLLRMNLAALTCGASKVMRTSLVICLTRLLSTHSEEALKFNFAQVLAYLFRQFTDENMKLYVCLLRFARVCVVKFSREHVQWMAPLLMRMFDNQACCLRARVFVRRVIQKLLHKLTRDQLMKIFPPEHIPLLRSIMTARRKKRNMKLRKALKAREEDGDEELHDGLFKTDDEGRLVLTLDEPEDTQEEQEPVEKSSSSSKQQKRVRNKMQKRVEVQPYTYIKLNKAKVDEKHKKENLKTFKSLLKGQNNPATQ